MYTIYIYIYIYMYVWFRPTLCKTWLQICKKRYRHSPLWICGPADQRRWKEEKAGASPVCECVCVFCVFMCLCVPMHVSMRALLTRTDKHTQKHINLPRHWLAERGTPAGQQWQPAWKTQREERASSGWVHETAALRSAPGSCPGKCVCVCAYVRMSVLCVIWGYEHQKITFGVHEPTLMGYCVTR